jgi:hypothetical protein
MTKLEECAMYILASDRETNDYYTYCEDNQVRPYFINKSGKGLKHIYEIATYALIEECAFDLEDWTVINDKKS